MQGGITKHKNKTPTPTVRVMTHVLCHSRIIMALGERVKMTYDVSSSFLKIKEGRGPAVVGGVLLPVVDVGQLGVVGRDLFQDGFRN